MADKSWHAKIQTNSMWERLVLAGLVTGALLSFGVIARTTDWFGWFVTIVAMFFMMIISNPLRGTRFDPASRPDADSTTGYWELIDIISDHPRLRVLSTNFGLRTLAALVTAVLIAVAEQTVSAVCFGSSEPSPLRGLVSLFVVLAPIQAVLARLRQSQEPDPWRLRLKSWAERALHLQEPDLPPWLRAVLSGVSKALLTTGLRALAMLILPWLFSTYWGIAFVGSVTLAVLLGGETIWAILTKLARIGQAPTTPDIDPTETKAP